MIIIMPVDNVNNVRNLGYWPVPGMDACSFYIQGGRVRHSALQRFSTS